MEWSGVEWISQFANNSIFYSFVMVAPDLGPKYPHKETNLPVSLASYKLRGSCRAEIGAFVSKGGTMCDIWEARADDVSYKENRSAAKIKKLEKQDYVQLMQNDDMVDVFGGKFSCCDRLHAQAGNDGDICDREKLLMPMLGMYCDMYKRRYNPSVMKIYALIEPRKNELYPTEIDVNLRGNKKRYVNLFDDLINICDKMIDFENMVEAASGER